jgi:hypothetical protein
LPAFRLNFHSSVDHTQLHKQISGCVSRCELLPRCKTCTSRLLYLNRMHNSNASGAPSIRLTLSGLVPMNFVNEYLQNYRFGHAVTIGFMTCHCKCTSRDLISPITYGCVNNTGRVNTAASSFLVPGALGRVQRISILHFRIPINFHDVTWPLSLMIGAGTPLRSHLCS